MQLQRAEELLFTCNAEDAAVDEQEGELLLSIAEAGILAAANDV